MLEMYVYEENQLLDQLEEIMLETERSGSLSTEHINEIFRIMHTIKGSSAMMAFQNISTLAHAVEDLFFYIRENHPESLDISAVCDLVLPASDFIKAEVSKLESGQQPDGDASAIEQGIKEFLQYISGEASGEAPAGHAPAAPAAEETPALAAEPAAGAQTGDGQKGARKYTAHLVFEEGGQMENLRAFNIVRNLTEYTVELYTNPTDLLGTPSETILQKGFDIFFSTAEPEERMRSLFDESLYLKSYELTPVDAYDDEVATPPAPPAEETPAQQPAAQPAPAKEQGAALQKLEKQPSASPAEAPKATKLNLISVNVGKLDMLMDLVGELVISESMVTKNPDLAGLELENFHKAARQLRKLTDELQDIVMSVRMVPIGGTFRKMQRIVRDMSHKLSKDVEFVTVGEETEVDKNIIDHLSDPLMHLIRNAMDHGVEAEEERLRSGKPRKARITLSAHNAGGDVKISVSDDGGGMDKDKILKKAAENGLLTKPVGDMTDREIFSLIMLPGFSTNDKVTEFSGRGVGMDVVKQNIEEVGGSISIKSIKGEGTTMTIIIPLTLAIADAMELSVGGNIFTLPTVSIKESFRPKEDSILYDNDNNEMIMIRGNVYPIIRLHRLFGIEPKVDRLHKGILIMVEGENRAACLFADELLGEQQVVVKPLPQYLIKCHTRDSGIEGCTILGDGSISLILNAKGLIDRVIG
ncbi:chemotaxis protein CheA [Ethanoligenens harbinense]|nr:chemotaxis protein CheA [Ethanoligenens harbinense YUAN-3]AYF39718.1 chemotaxis protein CheA [Ethanoligenens harbinense]AYF42551.1 chemotaxis protein CheA [Ethanoligenens harbinense]QCN93299.1 chemotaxis protein CheA [Ethanoligenens harbinense]